MTRRGVDVEQDDPGPQVDRSDARPLHVQIRDILRQQIQVHALLPGDTLPTEDELQRRFGVSRSVVRQALAGVADLGLIHRQRGRGSVVASSPVLRRHLQRAGGLDEQTAARGQHLQTHVLGLEAADPPAAARTALATDRAWRIERIRYLDRTPVVYMLTWVPQDLFPHFTAQLLEGTSLLALMHDHGYPAAGGPRQVQAVAADPDIARMLDVALGAPLLLLEGVTRDTRGGGLEWFTVWHRANTVFDIDAQVAPGTSTVSREQVDRLRAIVGELDSTLSELHTGDG